MLQHRKTTYSTNLRDVQISFNDGVCKLFQAQERTLGDLKGTFYFKNESVGINHYWQAYANNVGIDIAISIPYNNITIDTQDVVLIKDTYYTIARIQFHDTKKPNYWTLSLSKQQFSYVEAQ